MRPAVLSPVVRHALQDAIQPPALCDWCQRPFSIHKPRYAWDGNTYCSKGCRDLDLEEVVA